MGKGDLPKTAYLDSGRAGHSNPGLSGSSSPSFQWSLGPGGFCEVTWDTSVGEVTGSLGSPSLNQGSSALNSYIGFSCKTLLYESSMPRVGGMTRLPVQE